MTPENLAQSVNSIYSLPEVAMRVNELLNDPNTSSSDLEEVILCDPGLTTKILKFVNSAYFNFPRKVDNISHAISLIGQRELRVLVLSTSAISVFKGVPEKLIDMQSFWYHCVACGIMSRALAAKCRHQNLELFFIIGLLHNIGKLVFLCQYPEQYLPILMTAEKDEIAVLSAETKQFGFSHPELTAELLKQWNLPENIWQVILYQYHPSKAQAYLKDTYILHLAARIAEASEPYTKAIPDIKMLQQSFDEGVYTTLDLDEEIVQEIITDSMFQIMEVMEIIYPGFTNIY